MRNYNCGKRKKKTNRPMNTSLCEERFMLHRKSNGCSEYCWRSNTCSDGCNQWEDSQGKMRQRVATLLILGSRMMTVSCSAGEKAVAGCIMAWRRHLRPSWWSVEQWPQKE
jgi:hypothetical protein